MLFGENRLLLYLKKHSLEIYQQNLEPQVLSLPHEVVEFSEIVNGSKFEELLNRFIYNLGLKKAKILIILSDELIFHKEISTEDKINLVKKIESFLKTLPFTLQNTTSIDLPKGENLLLLATDNSVYLRIVEIMQNLGFNIEAVVPEGIFAGKNFKEIFASKGLILQGNFLKLNPKGQSGVVIWKQNKRSLLTKIILILTPAVLVSAVLIFTLSTMNKTKLDQNQVFKIQKIKVSTPSAQISSTESGTQSLTLPETLLSTPSATKAN